MLGLMLALLPLRGWAEVTMHLSAPALPSVAFEASLPPCHAVLAQGDDVAPEESGSGCSLCSLCHGSALCIGETSSARESATRTAPMAAPQGHGPPVLPLPERPPRA